MIAFFALYRIWFQIGAILVLVGGCVWGVHTYNEHFREIGRAEVRAEWVAAEQAAKIAADKQEAVWNKRLEEANANFTKRQEANQLALAAANTAVNGLSGSLARIRNGLSNNPSGSNSNTAAAVALANVFGDCVQKYIGMAEISGRHANDLQRFLDQWPKNEVKEK